MRDTRKAKAKRLAELVAKGPMFSSLASSFWNTPSAQYKRWSETWVMPLLLELVPELKVKKKIVQPSGWLSWDCPKSPTKKCQYDEVNDPAFDSCVHCGQPYERK